jgi:poly-beta-1,6-N-acetyl-D-glucosamine synthase
VQKWVAMPVFVSTQDSPKTTISVIVAARNEAQNIGVLLQKIAEQNFPKSQLEVLVIDDNSTDETANIIQKAIEILDKQLIIKYLYLENGQGKKAAITHGIAHAQHELIVTTDADCLPTTDYWLHEIACFYTQTNAKIVAAPVVFYHEKNALGRFQTADFVAMMAVTAAGISSRTVLMCNGANLAYPRSVFSEVGGFEGNTHIASGDDLFLMHKIAEKHPNDVHFLKSERAIMRTEPKHTWHEFWAQRLRWGTKNTAYNDWRITAVLGLVWLYCISFFVFALFFWFFGMNNGADLWLSLLLKMSADLWLLQQVAPFFGRNDLLKAKNFVPSFFLYLYYMLAIGTLSLVRKKYVWKARTVE